MKLTPEEDADLAHYIDCGVEVFHRAYRQLEKQGHTKATCLHFAALMVTLLSSGHPEGPPVPDEALQEILSRATAGRRGH